MYCFYPAGEPSRSGKVSWVQVVNQMYTIRRTLTLYVRLSQLRMTNSYFVLILEQPRLPNSERQHNFFEISNFSSTISMNLKFHLKLGMDLKIIPHKYGHICVGFFLTPFRTCSLRNRYVYEKRFTILKEVGTSNIKC